ncbi:hypothetical protein SJ05684_c21490 [Sinorhizobium sojae CCBAU 05684]|uniref:Uncharacterized protein n=1 Tax=Sinorhizobium sojae CCBAU 05684 TaxID=716928 RepID=A0A249PCA9_9HYPH|nr:hypothetical protein [Sinorhizobium sojae]ASY63590.1 hypothetical protein SJ05684_c21490 [Sinorhizobium sojae CCBAU 05684]
MQELEFTYEGLIRNTKKRERFFRLYDLIINDLMRDGYIQAARTRALHRKAIADDIKEAFGIEVPDLVITQ